MCWVLRLRQVLVQWSGGTSRCRGAWTGSIWRQVHQKQRPKPLPICHHLLALRSTGKPFRFHIWEPWEQTGETLAKPRGFIAGFLLRPLLEAFLRTLLLRLRMVRFRALGFCNGRSSVPKLVYRASSKPWQHELAESIPAVDCPNCSAHAEPYLPRLHKAMQHIYFTREEGRWAVRFRFSTRLCTSQQCVNALAEGAEELDHEAEGLNHEEVMYYDYDLDGDATKIDEFEDAAPAESAPVTAKSREEFKELTQRGLTYKPDGGTIGVHLGNSVWRAGRATGPVYGRSWHSFGAHPHASPNSCINFDVDWPCRKGDWWQACRKGAEQAFQTRGSKPRQALDGVIW